jgi:hypothetical protein
MRTTGVQLLRRLVMLGRSGISPAIKLKWSLMVEIINISQKILCTYVGNLLLKGIVWV